MKAPGKDNYKGKFFSTLKEEIIQILCKLFDTTEQNERLPNLFYDCSVTLVGNYQIFTRTLQESNVTGHISYEHAFKIPE